MHKQYERARATVNKASLNGPLAGVPYLIKDLATFEAGEPARFGSSLYADFIADHDSSYTARCKRAGLVIMGRSSTPELGISPSTEPRLFGPCRNPWNLAHSAGGSSGGAAAAVAAGILPVAHATDGGGSIRIPGTGDEPMVVCRRMSAAGVPNDLVQRHIPPLVPLCLDQ